MHVSICCVDRFLEEACGFWECEMGPSKEVVTTNGTEEGDPCGVSYASMEKGQLLHCSCEIIGICCSCLGGHVGTARVALHCVVQRDHVDVTGRVFSSG